MLCNPSGQSVQAYKHNSSKTSQKQQWPQQLQGIFLLQQQQQQQPENTPPPAAVSKQSWESSRQYECPVHQVRRLDKAAVLSSWLWFAVMLSMVTFGHAQSGTLGTCPVSIDYAVSLGQGGGDNSNVPVFVGSMGITNNANVRTTYYTKKLL